MEVDIPAGASLIFDVRGVPMVLRRESVSCGSDPQPVSRTLKSIEILIDRTSIEVFANDGEVSLSRCFLPNDTELILTAVQSSITLRSLTVYELKSSWV